jgi:tetratricopeptide (TPR) repeat protein
MLEDLDAQQALTSEARFRLVQLYQAEQDEPRVEAHLQKLVETPRPNPRYLAQYANLLLRQGKLSQVEPIVAKLTRTAPESFTTLALRVRVLKTQRNEKEAVALVQKYVEGKPPAAFSQAASLLEEIDPAAAEDLYRRFVAASNRPGDLLVLIRFLALQRKFDEAYALCDKAWETVAPEAAAAITVAVLREGKADEKQFQRFEARLRKACEAAPKNVALLLNLALLLDLQGRYADAQQAYRQALAVEGRNIVVLNNLAWLLAMAGGNPEEALKYVQNAVEISGLDGELLDTRAVVQLSRGRGDLAVNDMKEAIAQMPTPLRYFHLAQAHHLTKNHKAAADALQKAKKLGFQPNQLHALELVKYQQLVKDVQ